MRQFILRMRSRMRHGLVLADIAWRRFTRRVERVFLQRIISKRLRDVVVLEYFVEGGFLGLAGVTRVTTEIYHRRGYGVREGGAFYWEAPIAIAVWDKDGPFAGMALELRKDAICIRQLQGVSGHHAPEGARDWIRRFVACVQEAAIDLKVPEVRLYKADESLFYRYPCIEEREGQTWGEALLEHQQRMRRRYDGTARQMRFKEDRHWYFWNPAQEA